MTQSAVTFCDGVERQRKSIFSGRENDEYNYTVRLQVQQSATSNLRAGTWRRDIIFPLRRRPLGSVSLLAPHHTHLALEAYDLSVCVTMGFQHRTYAIRRPVRVSCDSLAERYPFVDRGVSDDGKVVETLRLGNVTLSSWIEN